MWLPTSSNPMGNYFSQPTKDKGLKDMRHTGKIVVDPVVFDQVSTWMEECKQVEDAGRDELLYGGTFDFGDGLEVDVSVYNSEDGPWSEAVMFQDGHEVAMSEVGESLDGEYVFTFEDNEYVVDVVRGES